MNSSVSEIPLFLFSKAPVPGKVKTRLLPQCNAQQAADIAKILLEESVKKCVHAWPGKVTLSVWLNQEDDFLQFIARNYSIEIELQTEGDLGEKMNNTLEQHGYPAAIMGCDAPHVTSSTLSRAHELLHQGRNVIAPSEDGGYYLIGLSQSCPVLFDNIGWGGERVYADTLVNATQQGLEHVELPSLNDVDTWSDVLSVAENFPSLQSYIKEKKL